MKMIEVEEPKDALDFYACLDNVIENNINLIHNSDPAEFWAFIANSIIRLYDITDSEEQLKICGVVNVTRKALEEKIIFRKQKEGE